jgi:sulfite exporter TauE/SafE
MLSSIHPLGERARHNRWGITVTAMTVGSVGAGALVGFALGGLGALVLPVAGEAAGLLIIGSGAVGAGAADLRKIPVPGPHRQVDETWIGPYRGWVYGGAFGIQLGSGVATYVVTWGVYATFLAALLSGSAGAGAIIGGVFGAGRALLPLAAGWIDRPSRLTAFHQKMAAWARPAARLAGIGLATVGIALMLLGATPV